MWLTEYRSWWQNFPNCHSNFCHQYLILTLKQLKSGQWLCWCLRDKVGDSFAMLLTELRLLECGCGQMLWDKEYLMLVTKMTKTVTKISNLLPSRQYSTPTLIYSFRAHRGRIRGFRWRKFSSQKCINIVELPSSPCHQKLCRQNHSCFNRCLW